MKFHEQSVEQEEEKIIADIQIGGNTNLAFENGKKAIDKETTLEGLNGWNLFVKGKGNEQLAVYLEQRKKQFKNE
jgi:hypothetical protein